MSRQRKAWQGAARRMRKLSNGLCGLSFVAAQGGLVLVIACGGSQSANPATADARAKSTAASPLTAQALNQRGEAIVRRGLLIGQTVRSKLEDARRESDIIKTTCLDDKRTEIDVNLRTAEARFEALKAATERGRRSHEFSVLSVLDQKLQALGEEASQCHGQSLYDTGKARLMADVDPATVPLGETAGIAPAIAPLNVTPPPPVSVAR